MEGQKSFRHPLYPPSNPCRTWSKAVYGVTKSFRHSLYPLKYLCVGCGWGCCWPFRAGARSEKSPSGAGGRPKMALLAKNGPRKMAGEEFSLFGPSTFLGIRRLESTWQQPPFRRYFRRHFFAQFSSIWSRVFRNPQTPLPTARNGIYVSFGQFRPDLPKSALGVELCGSKAL